MKVYLNIAIVNLDVESKFKSLFDTVLYFIIDVAIIDVVKTMLQGKVILMFCFNPNWYRVATLNKTSAID